MIISQNESEIIDLPCLNRRNQGLKLLAAPRSVNGSIRVSGSLMTGSNQQLNKWFNRFNLECE
ncbi:MAG: hypothetical protein EA001_11840 [Oscillatoriales cyanobacterium]|nr:MAG: hypothetical protein EA001_11840 [Oscillatoriales cyanobacterium]